ncbi:MAG: hypothetical protein IH822_01845 [Chloroflexi bacterium]|nr:hypothetical protein [Chloroflexota bacterium]
MSIFRRVSFLGFALVSLVVLAACGGDGDGGDGAFELPPPGEYSFEVTGTMEVLFLEDAVSAAPLAIGVPQVGNVSGGLTIQLGEDGKFTIKDREGVDLVVGDLEAGPITFTQNEDRQSTGTISGDGVEIELNVEAWQTGSDGPVTSRNEQPIRLESDGDPFSDEGATLSTPPDAEAVNFVSVDNVDPSLIFGLPAVFISLFGGFGIDLVTPVFTPSPDAELPTDTEEQGSDFTDAEGDEYECAGGPDAVVDDGDVDILSVGVTQEIDGVEVRVKLRESPPEGKEWFSSSLQVQIGQEGRFQVGQREDHAGEPNTGRLDDAGQVIPDSEDDVTGTDNEVTFFFPDLVLEEGDTVTARSFHQEKEGDPVHCDVTDAFSLSVSGLELVPCGGECTREE